MAAQEPVAHLDRHTPGLRLQLTLPPQGRLLVAAREDAGRLPGPGLVLGIEHKDPMGSQTVAALLDRPRALALWQTLEQWLLDTEPGG